VDVQEMVIAAGAAGCGVGEEVWARTGLANEAARRGADRSTRADRDVTRISLGSIDAVDVGRWFLDNTRIFSELPAELAVSPSAGLRTSRVTPKYWR
jgi:hypothetical protein